MLGKIKGLWIRTKVRVMHLLKWRTRIYTEGYLKGESDCLLILRQWRLSGMNMSHFDFTQESYEKIIARQMQKIDKYKERGNDKVVQILRQ